MAKVHKTPMYECQAFFPEGFPKKWKYVTDLKSFAGFLSKSHPQWKYFNVYQKGTKQYLKRFYPGNLVPKALGLAFLFLTQKFTFGNTPAVPYPYENTSSKTTSSLQALSSIKNTSGFTTSNTSNQNGFNNTATISTQANPKNPVL